MVFEKATRQDIEQLVKLRVAYLFEDYGGLNEKNWQLLKEIYRIIL